jgi:hypothetical protein
MARKNVKKRVKKSSVKKIVRDKVSSGKGYGAPEYKNELINSNNEEARYNTLFEQKLAEQYKDFRKVKDHQIHSATFLRMLMVILTIIILALLILSYK